MTSPVAEDDLRLALAVARTGSVGAAARRLQVSQPSASQRLGRLERRVGVVLFERDTRGARATVAGRELVRQAEHILGHLDGVAEAVRSASHEQALTVGTFASLAGAVFPVLDQLLGVTTVLPRVDHGDRLVEWVDEATLAGAFVAIADQLTLPRDVRVHRVGVDTLVLFLPDGVDVRRSGRQPLRGLAVPYTVYDLTGPTVHARLAAQGASPRRAATSGAALAMARRSGQPAVVPRSVVAEGLRSGERLQDLSFTHRFVLSLVTGPDPDERLLGALPGLRTELALG